MATITFILIFYSISIRVIIIYRLIQELGSIRLILGIGCCGINHTLCHTGYMVLVSIICFMLVLVILIVEFIQSDHSIACNSGSIIHPSIVYGR